MRKLLAGLLAAAVLVPCARAATDFQCFNDCTARRYSFNYCQSKCSYDDQAERMLRQQADQNRNQQYEQQQQRPATIDFQCQGDCLQRGYMLNYCNSRCSY